jgi:hypothetical protein
MPVALTALVAGHRPDRLPAGEGGERLFSELDKLLTLLRDVAGDEDAALRVLTGAAEGTDEETARIAERLKVPLHLFAPGQPQPLTVSQKRAERMVWLGAVDDALHSHEAFAIRDEIALSFSDLLVVVWDGQSLQGLSGGTVRLAFQAALMMKPIVWLHTDGTLRMLDRTRLDASSLHKLRCPHPKSSWLQDCFTIPLDETSLRHQLADAVQLILDPSRAASDQDKVRLKDYRTEAGKAGENPPPVPTRLIEARFERADVEATAAAGRYRAITWMLYGASAMAVLAAVAGAIELWPGGHNAFWPVVELVLIAGIVGGFMLAKRRCWHEKWLGNRFVAEQLRYEQMCLPLLGLPRPFKAPAWQIANGLLHLSSAELWFIQRTLTMEGLPQSKDGTAFIASSEDVKARLADYVAKVVRNQQSYHHNKHHKLHATHKRLHWLSLGLFGATALAVLAHFVIHANWLLICTAFFPALAAAVHGLATTLEITRISGQSAVAESELGAIVSAIEQAGNQSGWEGWLRLRQLVLEASRVMSDENSQWQQLIRDQKTTLPA